MANITFSDKQLFMHVFFQNLLYFFFAQTRHPRPGPVFSMEGHKESLKSAKGLKLGTNQRDMK